MARQPRIAEGTSRWNFYFNSRIKEQVHPVHFRADHLTNRASCPSLYGICRGFRCRYPAATTRKQFEHMGPSARLSYTTQPDEVTTLYKPVYGIGYIKGMCQAKDSHPARKGPDRIASTKCRAFAGRRKIAHLFQGIGQFTLGFKFPQRPVEFIHQQMAGPLTRFNEEEILSGQVITYQKRMDTRQVRFHIMIDRSHVVEAAGIVDQGLFYIWPVEHLQIF